MKELRSGPVRDWCFCRFAWLPLAAIAPLFGTSPNFAGDAPALRPLSIASGSPRLPGKFVWAARVAMTEALAAL